MVDPRSSAPATISDRRALASIFIDLRVACERTHMSLTETGPAVGSRAEQRTGDEPWHEGGYVEVTTAVATAVNHLEALTLLMSQGTPLGASMQALTRASVESFGRASYLLLPADNDSTLRQRRAALLYAEIQPYDDAAILVGGVDGTVTTTVRDFKAQIDLERGTERSPRYTALAKGVMTAAGLPHVDALYSSLSSGAHGETMGTAGLRIDDPRDTDRFTTIGLPLRDADLIGNVTVWCAIHTLRALVAEFGDVEVHQRWDHDVKRIVADFDTLRSRWIPRLTTTPTEPTI